MPYYFQLISDLKVKSDKLRKRLGEKFPDDPDVIDACKRMMQAEYILDCAVKDYVELMQKHDKMKSKFALAIKTVMKRKGSS